MHQQKQLSWCWLLESYTHLGHDYGLGSTLGVEFVVPSHKVFGFLWVKNVLWVSSDYSWPFPPPKSTGRLTCESEISPGTSTIQKGPGGCETRSHIEVKLHTTQQIWYASMKRQMKEKISGILCVSSTADLQTTGLCDDLRSGLTIKTQKSVLFLNGNIWSLLKYTLTWPHLLCAYISSQAQYSAWKLYPPHAPTLLPSSHPKEKLLILLALKTNNTVKL